MCGHRSRSRFLFPGFGATGKVGTNPQPALTTIKFQAILFKCRVAGALNLCSPNIALELGRIRKSLG
jgi:hypothetical protein